MTSDEQVSLSKWSCGCTACVGAGEDGGGGAAGAGDGQAWRALCAEAAGTALLVALTCLASCAAPAAPLLQRALAGGLVVTVLVQCFDHVSGAMLNPTVTLAAVLRGRVSGARAGGMVAAQLAGAAAGPALLRALAPPDAPPDALLCLTLPADHVSVYKAVGVEALLGGCLALANCAAWDARNRLLVESWPARVGLVVAALSLVGGELTGASMNPMRSFGPALWAGNFDRHWVYWAGPLGGSLLFTGAYAAAWRAPPHAPARGAPAGPARPHAPPAPRACPHAPHAPRPRKPQPV